MASLAPKYQWRAWPMMGPGWFLKRAICMVCSLLLIWPLFAHKSSPADRQKSAICTNLLHTKQGLCVHWNWNRQCDRRGQKRAKREKPHCWFFLFGKTPSSLENYGQLEWFDPYLLYQFIVESPSLHLHSWKRAKEHQIKYWVCL